MTVDGSRGEDVMEMPPWFGCGGEGRLLTPTSRDEQTGCMLPGVRPTPAVL